jgi:hypothetical protein
VVAEPPADLAVSPEIAYLVAADFHIGWDIFDKHSIDAIAACVSAGTIVLGNQEEAIVDQSIRIAHEIEMVIIIAEANCKFAFYAHRFRLKL